MTDWSNRIQIYPDVEDAFLDYEIGHRRTYFVLRFREVGEDAGVSIESHYAEELAKKAHQVLKGMYSSELTSLVSFHLGQETTRIQMAMDAQANAETA